MSKRDEHIKLDATPEEVAAAIFAAAHSPDPTKRKRKGRLSTGQAQDEVEDEIVYMRKPAKKNNE